jgi:hypothetical protein
MFYSLLLYCFTFFGERGEVPIGLSFSAGVPKKVEVILIRISLNLIEGKGNLLEYLNLYRDKMGCFYSIVRTVLSTDSIVRKAGVFFRTNQ